MSDASEGRGPLQPIVETIWKEKYRLVQPDGSSLESSPADSLRRVASAVFANDPRRDEFEPLVAEAMVRQEWCPGGRIHAGAGSGRRVTLINCFVNQGLEDSMAGIMAANTRAALTMQQGGGIGTDFSTLRPKGAVVAGVASVASGPLSFMEIWQAMCGTIMSGGSRRGAMMATLADDHPDLPDFIVAKREKGRLTNFNLSVLVSDAFMRAVEADEDWELGFGVRPADPNAVITRRERDGQPWYVYKRLPARELWETITRNSYDWAEPGVIFIDRVNEWNNLGYIEDIRCTNPCGEQPLPPNGACNLGCVNLAVLVREPFTSHAHVDVQRLAAVTRLGIRFLDNVIDLTAFPVPEQRREAEDKRRTGLGIMGLGNALQMLGVRYGSLAAEEVTGRIMETLRDAAYEASIELAVERGPFPAFEADRYLDRPFIRQLPDRLRTGIAENGIRNGVLMTIAPTGTTAIYYNNVSSGLEPTFGWRYFRKVLQPDGSWREFAVVDAGFEAWCRHHGLDPATAPTGGLPESMVTALDLSVEDHVRMQATCQRHIDASISKTINCPPEMSYDEFQAVYRLAYDLGCKGCTTYRPSGTRGSILSTEESGGTRKDEPRGYTSPPAEIKRPDTLVGKTYKAKWPLTEDNLYVTINDIEDHGRRRPYEIFIASRSAEHAELMSALTLTLSAVMRRSENPTFLVEDLERVRAAQGAWVEGRYVNGVVALIAGVMRRHLEELGLIEGKTLPPARRGSPGDPSGPRSPPGQPGGELCPKCDSPTLFRQEGCKRCVSCGYSTCG
ncbi:MAG: adenosylcobalamin-dependent ribonucleoside-diphosphate reductase [Rhodospirillaceae bacterium]